MTDDILKGATILVVDDQAIVRDFFTEALNRRNVNIMTAVDGKDALRRLEETQPDLVITDLKMPNMDGMQLLRHILGMHPNIPVIMLTAYATVENAVEAMRIGAFDYISKPVTDLGQLDLTLRRALQHRQLLVENQQLRGELNDRYRFDRLVGPSPQMQRVFELLATVAPTPTTVLVLGESGTGKELVARAIHFNSPRAKAPFIKLNCAAMPEGLIESELFGHEKGAFTGAVRTTQGKFEAAHNGTLLLDEIGELPMGLQAKLLRVLQEREFEPLGSERTERVDVRVIAATNRDLHQLVAEGKSQEDLFYRLNVIPIHIPPLREHREDIRVLVEHFVRKHAQRVGRRFERIDERLFVQLEGGDWPGNVRELENTVERAVVLSRGPVLGIDAISVPGPAVPQPGALPSLRLHQNIEWTERETLRKAIEAAGGVKKDAAELMGISQRALSYYVAKYRLDAPPKS